MAGVSVTPNSSCVYVLDTGSTGGALTISGAAVLTASGCGVYVNSSNSKAITVSGGGTARLNATPIEVHGGTSPTICGSECSVVPTTSAPVVADPFLSVAAPTVPNNCYATGYSLGSSNTATISATDPSTGAVRVYCGGIDITGTAVLTMNPGTYIVNGGGFTVEHSGTVNGTGVTIFLTGQFGQTNAPLTMEGSSHTNLSAPTGGTYQGILFYQDRSASYAGQNTFSGSAAMDCTGSLLLPVNDHDVFRGGSGQHDRDGRQRSHHERQRDI